MFNFEDTNRKVKKRHEQKRREKTTFFLLIFIARGDMPHVTYVGFIYKRTERRAKREKRKKNYQIESRPYDLCYGVLGSYIPYFLIYKTGSL